MARTAKKSTAKKNTTKKTTTKPVAANTNARKTVDRSVTLPRLYKFNLFTAAVNLIFAVLSIVFIGRQTIDMNLSFATKDVLASTNSDVFGPAYRALATVELRYLLGAIFLISAVFSLLLATRLRKVYENGVKNSTAGIRWLFMGITLALVLEFATLLAGVQDIMTLKLVAGLVFTTSVLAWLNERENKGTKKQYAVFGLSVFTGLIAWLPLAASLKGTWLYGVSNFGWHVYALAAAVLLGFISIGLSQYRHTRDGISAKGYLQLEGKYVSTDFLIKLAVFAIIVSALHK